MQQWVYNVLSVNGMVHWCKLFKKCCKLVKYASEMASKRSEVTSKGSVMACKCYKIIYKD